jgi:hypothetical protein
MKSFLLSILILVNCHLLFSQAAANPILSNPGLYNYNFVFTSNGNVLPGNIIEFSNRCITESIVIDSMSIDLSMVEFINYSSVFYAVNKQDKSGMKFLIPRTFKGNMNIFSDIRFVSEREYTGVYVSSDQIWAEYCIGIRKQELNYYNRGFDDLKLCSYKNLCFDLAESPQSMILLNKSMYCRNGSIILDIAGIVSVFVGLNYAYHHKDSFKEHMNFVKSVIPVGLGLSFVWLGNNFSDKSTRLKIDAIKAY